MAPEVGHIYVVVPSGSQAGGPRLGGGTRAPATADRGGSMLVSGLVGGLVAVHPGIHLFG